jgi:hypothetical protein
MCWGTQEVTESRIFSAANAALVVEKPSGAVQFEQIELNGEDPRLFLNPLQL